MGRRSALGAALGHPPVVVPSWVPELEAKIIDDDRCYGVDPHEVEDVLVALHVLGYEPREKPPPRDPCVDSRAVDEAARAKLTELLATGAEVTWLNVGIEVDGVPLARTGRVTVSFTLDPRPTDGA